MQAGRRFALGILACGGLATGPAPDAEALVAYGANDIFDVAEYALGSYTLNVVFIQDDQLRNPNTSTHPIDPNGQVVHWTPSELTERMQRIADAVDFWNDASAARHHPAARLNISINWVNAGDPITVNDIGGEGSTNAYGDALAQVDPIYGSYSDFTATRHFAHNTRQQFGTNWAWTTFVKPYNGRASAYLNGPLTNGYEDDPSWTYAHEFGHIFGALDEYGSAKTDQRGGYLYAYNTNADNLPDGSPNPDSVSALMKVHGNYTFSDGALNQIGWTDSDNDTIPDILDTFPTVNLLSISADPALGILEIDLDAHVSPLASPDPSEGDYTINTLVNAEFRVNLGDWQPLTAADGLIDAYTEFFTFEQLNLPAGQYDFEFRVTNSVDNATTSSYSFLSERVIVDPAVPGDTDGDGDIDDADLARSFSNYTGPNGSGKTAAQGDTNNDGDVDDADLAISFSNYTGPLTPANVPEPASLLTLALPMLAMSRRRRPQQAHPHATDSHTRARSTSRP